MISPFCIFYLQKVFFLVAKAEQFKVLLRTAQVAPSIQFRDLSLKRNGTLTDVLEKIYNSYSDCCP